MRKYGIAGTTAVIALTGKTTSIAATNIENTLLSGDVYPAGFIINYVLACTTEDGAAVKVVVTFSWTDPAGAASVASADLVLTAKGRIYGTIPVVLSSGAIQYATTVTTIGTSKYALFVTVERLT